MKKRLLAAILCLVLAASLPPTAALAAKAEGPYDFADAQPVSAQLSEATAVLAGLGIMKGYPDGSLGLERAVTRAEMATMLAVALGYGDLANGTEGPQDFYLDMENHWAEGYIAYATDLGIINGRGNGIFDPDATVTYQEAATMMLRTIGYTNETVNGGGSDAHSGANYTAKAKELGMLDDVAATDTSVGANRGDVALMTTATLEQNMVYTGDDGLAKPVLNDDGSNKTLIGSLGAKDKKFYVSMEELSKGHPIDLTPYLYETVEAYLKGGKVYSVDRSLSKTVRGTVWRLDPSLILICRADGTVSSFIPAGSYKICLNGQEYTDLSCLMSAFGGEIKAVTNERSFFTGLVVEKYDKAKVAKRSYISGKTKFDDYALPTDKDGKPDHSKITVTGDATSLYDIQPGDVIEAAQNGSKAPIKLRVTRKIVEGTISKVEGGKYFIGGEAYELGESYSDLSAVAPGAEGKFRLNSAGKIVDFTPCDVTWRYGVIVASHDNGDGTTGVRIVGGDGKANDYKMESSAFAAVSSGGGISLAVDHASESGYVSVMGTGYKLVRYRLNAERKLESLAPAAVIDVPATKGVTAESAAFLADEHTAILNLDASGALTKLSPEEIRRGAALDYQYVLDGGGWAMLILRDGAAKVERRCGLLAGLEGAQVTLVTAGEEKAYQAALPPEGVKVGDIVSYTLTDGALTAIGPFEGETYRSTLKAVTEHSLTLGNGTFYFFAPELSIFSGVTTAGAYQAEDLAALRAAVDTGSRYANVSVYHSESGVAAAVIGRTHYYDDDDPAPVISTLYGLFTGLDESGKAMVLGGDGVTTSYPVSPSMGEGWASDIAFDFVKLTLSDGVITSPEMLTGIDGSFVSLGEGRLTFTPHEGSGNVTIPTADVPIFVVTGAGENRTAALYSDQSITVGSAVTVYRENGFEKAMVLEATGA